MKKLKVAIVSLITLILLVSCISGSRKNIVYDESDLETIKDIIMDDYRCPTNYKMRRLDINNDNKITSLDYVMIKNKMKGR